MSEFKFACPHCGQQIQCEMVWIGHETSCPTCQQRFVVPSLGPSVTEVTPSHGTQLELSSGSEKYSRCGNLPWYLKLSVLKPARYISDYLPAELMSFRESFKPLAERYRRYQGVAYLALVLGLCIGLFVLMPVLLLHSTTNPWVVFPLLLCVAIYGILVVLVPVPRCPACHNRLDRGFGAFCPECGARALERATWFREAQCSSCARPLTRGKTRHYKIRACTHCGVQLDEEGV